MVVLPEPPFGFSTTMRCMNVPVVREDYVLLGSLRSAPGLQARDARIEDSVLT